MAADAPVPSRRRLAHWPIGLGVLAAGLLGYFVVAPAVQTAILRTQLASETTAALAASRVSADAAHATWIGRVAPALGLGPDAVYSATYDVCYVDHTDGGWLALNYNQNCRLAYVDFYALPAQNDAVDAAIRDASSTYGTGTSGTVYTDDYLGAAGLETKDRPKDLPFTLQATLPGATDARAATDSWMVADVVAYAVDDAFTHRRLLTDTGRQQLDPHQRFLVVSQWREYYHRDIGCAIGRPVFCSSPLGAS